MSLWGLMQESEQILQFSNDGSINVLQCKQFFTENHYFTELVEFGWL